MGVGKTSMVNLLAERFNARKILDDDNNPFLEGFYRHEPGAAFQTQLYFLLTRYRQQVDLAQQDLFNQCTICDYLFFKDRIFAHLTLTESELVIYEKVFDNLVGNVPKPDLVIYLQGMEEVLMSRVFKRQKQMELQVAKEYFLEMNKAFNYFFFHYDMSPLLVINTTEIDFVDNQEDLDHLCKQILAMNKGTRYYVPLGSQHS